jgi:signal transduction histidine kinase
MFLSSFTKLEHCNSLAGWHENSYKYSMLVDNFSPTLRAKTRRRQVSIRNHLLFVRNGGLDSSSADSSELRKRRTLAIFSVSLALIACFLMLTNLYFDAESDNPFIAAGLISLVFALYLQAYFNSRHLAANLVVCTYWLVDFLLIFDHGLIGTPIFWLFPVAPMAILFSGVKSGIFWCIVCIATIFLFWYLENSTILIIEDSLTPIINLAWEADGALIFANDSSIVLILLTLATIVFKNSQSCAESKLQESVESLQKEVTTRAIAERKAIDSEQAKSAFFAAMSHELRTPLNGVIGAAQLLKDSREKPDIEKLTRIIMNSGETLLELINDVLDLSSLEAGKMSLESRKISLPEFLDQVLLPFDLQAQAKHIKLSSGVSDDAPAPFYCDPTRLRQVIINLVGNAIKFTSEGEIQVLLDSQDQTLRVRVIDTGIGIPENALAKLFEPYVQADADTMRKYGGSGLGLAIVSKLVTAMAGSIVVESELGTGSCFTFLVPSTAKPQITYKQPSPQSSNLPALKVMVVDDNAVNRMVLARMLENDNHEVISLTDGKEAVAFANSMSLDVVLMDIQMPVMDGLTACKLIRQSDSLNANIPIIAISANFTSEDKAAALSAGMNGFVTKPFRFQDITSKIAQCL